MKNKKTNDTIPVPCGKCPDCKKRRTSGWSFRLVTEEKRSSSALFITLTYDTTHVPITQNGFMCLNKRDVQLFIKRLRKAQTPDITTDRIKYFAVGEYGGKTNRPHYHLILFNADRSLIQDAWGRQIRSYQYVWKHPKRVEHRQHIGSVHYGTVSGASIGYTLKYLMKPSKIPMHRNDDRQREFSLMSKGLGENYLTNNMVRWHHQDMENRMYVTTLDGKKVAMPRYLKNKIYTEQERKQVAYFTLQKILREEKEAIKNDPNYFEKKAESAKAQFKKMHYNSTKGDKL